MPHHSRTRRDTLSTLSTRRLLERIERRTMTPVRSIQHRDFY